MQEAKRDVMQMLMMCSFDVACSQFGVLFCFAPNEGDTKLSGPIICWLTLT
jgi:hypothetical protein